LSIPTLLISLIWAYTSWYYIIPLSGPEGQVASRFLERWAQYGDSYFTIAFGICRNVWSVLGLAAFALCRLLFPWVFLPLLAPGTLLIALPLVILQCASEFDLQQKLLLHYAAPILPIFYWASVKGLKRLISQKTYAGAGIQRAVFTALILINVGYSLIDKNCYKFDRLFSLSKYKSRHLMLDQIPAGAQVLAQSLFVPHLSNKSDVRMYPGTPEDSEFAQFLVLDTSLNPWPLKQKEIEATVNKLKHSKIWQKIGDADGASLWKKRTTPSAKKVLYSE